MKPELRTVLSRSVLRLNVFPLSLPPLRERSEDIPDLVWHFVRRFGARMNKDIDEIPDEVMEALRIHDWSDNIRELQNVIERAVIMSTGPFARTCANCGLW
jgi:formate hydrogenlyase transcriptional activator